MKYLRSLQDWLETKPYRADIAAILLLSILWAFYFWRVLTPNQANQMSLPEGDYTGQFLAFSAYQAERVLEGEIPLWNPYNRAGHPFLADTQAAVFYPPRLIAILASGVTGNGWNYAVLQAETLAHFWLASVFMFLLSRVVTRSRIAGIVSSIIFTYGGFLTGYPPLQLAILEAAVWLPLALLGIHKATEGNPKAPQAWLALSSVALGVGLLAGHPQTSLYSAYLCIAYLIYRSVVKKARLLWILSALFIVVGLGFGIAAAQLLPGLEYTRLTTRSGYGYDQLANGFPLSDLLSALLPDVLSLWSPLYSGIPALLLAALAVASRSRTARFWVGAIAVALALSFGRHTIMYALAYLTVPGFSMFRGQERAAFIISISLAMLAGLGTAALLSGRGSSFNLARYSAKATFGAWVLAAALFVVERAIPREEIYAALRAGVFLAVVCTLLWVLMSRPQLTTQAWWRTALIALVVFDLFTVTMGTNWEPIPPSQRHLLSDLVPIVVDDEALYRVDGRLGLGENFGTMVGVQDVRGISPLWLGTLENYYQLPEARLYQLLSVKYVFTDWQQLAIPSTVIAQAQDGNLPLYLHQITDPSPRAWMTYTVMDTQDRSQALGWLADASFDPLHTVILPSQPDLALPSTAPVDWEVTISSYRPERIELSVDTPTDGILVISEMDYPGWIAFVDGEQVPILHADAGIRAIALQAGSYHVILEYQPISFKIGAAIAVISVILLTAITSRSLMQRKQLVESE